MNSRWTKWILTVILIASFGFSAFASNGTQIGTVGARSTAMGSNFRGLADDWSAFFFNPAGITQLNKLTIGISMGLIAPRGSYTPFNLDQLPFSGMGAVTEGTLLNQKDLVKQNFMVPALGIFYKPTDKLSVGVGVSAPFGLGAKYDLMKIPDTYGNANASDLDGNESLSDHQVVNVQAVAAYKLTDKLSVGASAGYIPVGKMKLNQMVLPSYLKAAPALTNLVAILKGTKVWNPDHERLVVESILDGKGNAISASLGILFKPSENLSFGLSGKYYSDLELTGTFKQKTHFPGAPPTYAAGIKGYFASIKGAQTLDSLTALGGLALGFGGKTSEENWDAKAILPLPMTVGGGVAYKPFPRLTLVADLSLTRWSTWKIINVDLTSTTSTQTKTMDENWKNTLEYGLGAEFRALEKEGMKLDLRVGAYTTGSPVPSETLSALLMDPSRRYVLTGGFGVNLGKISLDLAGEYVTFSNDYPATKYFYDTTLGQPENMPGKYLFHAIVITGGVTINL